MTLTVSTRVTYSGTRTRARRLRTRACARRWPSTTSKLLTLRVVHGHGSRLREFWPGSTNQAPATLVIVAKWVHELTQFVFSVIFFLWFGESRSSVQQHAPMAAELPLMVRPAVVKQFHYHQPVSLKLARLPHKGMRPETQQNWLIFDGVEKRRNRCPMGPRRKPLSRTVRLHIKQKSLPQTRAQNWHKRPRQSDRMNVNMTLDQPNSNEDGVRNSFNSHMKAWIVKTTVVRPEPYRANRPGSWRGWRDAQRDPS